jgi:hypothetical protein
MSGVSDKTGRAFAFGFCGACGAPLNGPGKNCCDAQCQRDFDHGKRPVGLTGVRYEHHRQEARAQA